MDITSFFDGGEPIGWAPTIDALRSTWARHYSPAGEVRFSLPLNLKQAADRKLLPARLRSIAEVRNPDFFFFETTHGVELGGLETTVHSPDGSNVEKRYPYIWVSQRQGVDGIIACPLLKTRPGGQVNRLPFRHLARNLKLLARWQPADAASPLCQILPVRELHGQDDLALVPKSIRGLIPGWKDLGALFAHRLASATLGGVLAEAARAELGRIHQTLLTLSQACQAGTSDTEPSTLIQQPGRWIQVYNARPDSGHWERGEGQFDSIDGRLMFTLDGLDSQRPRPKFEFWLPQIVSAHPWIREQIRNGHGSKRLRNILVVLAPYCTTRFADALTAADWDLLQRNPTLLLERLDWPPADIPRRERRAAVETQTGGLCWPFQTTERRKADRGASGRPAPLFQRAQGLPP